MFWGNESLLLGPVSDLTAFFAAESVARGLQVEPHFNGITNELFSGIYLRHLPPAFTIVNRVLFYTRATRDLKLKP